MQAQLLETLLILAHALFMQNKHEKAHALLVALNHIAPDNVAVLRQYAVLLYDMDRAEEALIGTEKLLSLETDKKSKKMAKYLHASALWQVGREEECRALLKEIKL